MLQMMTKWFQITPKWSQINVKRTQMANKWHKRAQNGNQFLGPQTLTFRSKNQLSKKKLGPLILEITNTAPDLNIFNFW